jgi:hypothetical protein
MTLTTLHAYTGNWTTRGGVIITAPTHRGNPAVSAFPSPRLEGSC